MAQFSGGAIAIVKRHGGRGDGLPATIVERQLMASLPGAAQDALRPGMTQLDPQTDRRPGPNIFDYAAQGVFGFIIPQPQIPGRYALQALPPWLPELTGRRRRKPVGQDGSGAEVALPSSAEY